MLYNDSFESKNMLKQPDVEKDKSVMIAVLDETRNNGGFWDVAAYELGYDMAEIKRLLDTYPNFKEATDAAEDFATRAMATEMYKSGRHRKTYKAQEFWLETKGARLGFSRKKHVEIELSEKDKITADKISKDPVEAAKQYQRLMNGE